MNVILDTDIGTDVDDTWALLQLLASPELDLKLVVTTGGNTEYRARLAAKLLAVSGRGDVPIAMGERGEGYCEYQADWLGDYSIDDYPGVVGDDPIAAYRAIAAEFPDLTVISIGPATNVARLVSALPELVPEMRFVGMHGSVYLGYGGQAPPVPEANVKADAPALRTVLAAPWRDRLLTPLDTCGLVVLEGERYQRLRTCSSPSITALMENYAVWAGSVTWEATPPEEVPLRSSTLFDTVAVYLAYDERFVHIESKPIGVTTDGRTVIDPTGPPVRLALGWSDLDAFLDQLVERLCGL